MADQLYIQSCTAANIGSDGVCTVPVWIEKPQPVLPPLTLAEGTQIAFAIAGCWALGLVYRQYARVSRERF
ncbi:hypothetical protein [Xanthomonas sacchari]|uniref:hypothetical protein n=1 Tax=Xanthomonas sacchari TaxID=56458 RepID=UPI0012E03C65|nr:hypothetical protein [Xanthomonas sacchari]